MTNETESDLATIAYLAGVADEKARGRAAVAELVEALRPFVDLGPQKGAWGVISKKLGDFAPMTVTVTKAQMLAACNAVRRHQAGLGKGDDRG